MRFSLGFVLLAAIDVSALGQTYTIKTVAGTPGTSGFCGVSGAGTSLCLADPRGVAVDGVGDIYIADFNWIWKVTPDGQMKGIANVASHFPVRGLAVDSKGVVYVAAQGTHEILKVDTAGIVSVIAGNGNPGYSGDGGPALNALVNAPSGVALDSGGNLYIADSGNNVIRKLTLDGIITTIVGNGTKGYSGDGGPAMTALLSSPTGLAVGNDGSVYIADSGNFVIRRVLNGTITTAAGTGVKGKSGDGGPAKNAQLNTPVDVAVDTTGNLFIVDT